MQEKRYLNILTFIIITTLYTKTLQTKKKTF